MFAFVMARLGIEPAAETGALVPSYQGGVYINHFEHRIPDESS